MTASPAGPVPRTAPRGRLFRKYVVSFVAVVAVALVTNSAIDIWFSYSEQKRLLIGIQREQAESAAAKIAQFVGEIERQIGWLAQLPQGAITREDLRIDAIRLLRLAPAIAEVAQLERGARAVARVAPRGGRDRQQGRPLAHRGVPRRQGGRRVLRPGLFLPRDRAVHDAGARGPGSDPAVTVAEVNLRFIWDLVSEIKVGASGNAYVVDRRAG